MANINENRKLMIEQIARAKAELNEGTKYLKLQDKKGKQIMQTIYNNIDLVDVGRYGMDAQNALPVLKNGVKLAIKHKYKLHSDIGDVPKNTHRHYWRYDSKKQMQDTLDNTKKVFKEWLTLIDAAIKRPSKASLKRVKDKWQNEIYVDSGARGTLYPLILKSGDGQSSVI